MIFAAVLAACTSATPPAAEVLTPRQVASLAQSTRGQVHAISLWAMWCAPCLQELEVLATFEPDELQTLLVNVDTAAEFERRVSDWLTEQEWNNARHYRVSARDPIGELSREWPSWGGTLPYTVFVHPDGRVCETHSEALPRAEVAEAIERCKQ